MITTNSISQTSNRKVLNTALNSKQKIHLSFSIPDHPWVDNQESAAVRIAMTVGVNGEGAGTVGTVESKEQNDDGTSKLEAFVC